MDSPVQCVLLSRDNCINGQITDEGLGLTSTDHGMQIRYAAEIRRDDVYHRLNVLSPNGNIFPS